MGLASGPLQLLMVSALYHASAATVAPMSYTNMLWAILIGYVWFGDVPTLCGAGRLRRCDRGHGAAGAIGPAARELHTKSACDAGWMR